MKHLIIGGSAGLGLELAKNWAEQGKEVIVTGRKDPEATFAEFREFELSQPDLPKAIGEFVMTLPEVESLTYAAGFFQEGRVTDISEQDIEDMLNVGGRGLIYFVRELLKKQDKLDEFVAITSTSQWTPRQLEPIYNFVKAGEGHFANAIAEDGRVGKVLVAGPAGMDTPFWREDPARDRSKMLDPAWVAEQITAAQDEEFSYKYIRILREPPRVELVEQR